jgi:hypothetical protein
MSVTSSVSSPRLLALPVNRSMRYRPGVPPTRSVASAVTSDAAAPTGVWMSKPAAASASTPSAPIGANVPAFAGDWIDTRSAFVSSTNSAVPVPVSSSLLV